MKRSKSLELLLKRTARTRMSDCRSSGAGILRTGSGTQVNLPVRQRWMRPSFSHWAFDGDDQIPKLLSRAMGTGFSPSRLMPGFRLWRRHRKPAALTSSSAAVN